MIFAEFFAEMNSLNLHAYTTNKHGVIVWSGDAIFLSDVLSEGHKQGFSSLFAIATDSSIITKNGILEIKFTFDLCEKIKVNDE